MKENKLSEKAMETLVPDGSMSVINHSRKFMELLQKRRGDLSLDVDSLLNEVDASDKSLFNNIFYFGTTVESSKSIEEKMDILLSKIDKKITKDAVISGHLKGALCIEYPLVSPEYMEAVMQNKDTSNIEKSKKVNMLTYLVIDEKTYAKLTKELEAKNAAEKA